MGSPADLLILSTRTPAPPDASFVTDGPSPDIFLPPRYQSRFSLLNAFCDQLGEAGHELGLRVNPPRELDPHGERPALFILFNFAPSMDFLASWMGNRRGPTVLANWLVDHPFTLAQSMVDQFVKQPGYRLVTVSEDEAHVLPLRFPMLQHWRTWHGVPRNGLCDPAAIAPSHSATTDTHAGRDIDVLFAGSIVDDATLEAWKAHVPSVLHRACADLVQLRLAHPWLSFSQAFDLTMPAPMRTPDHWGLLALVFRLSTAQLNRARRERVLASLQGLRVHVVGNQAIRALCGGSVRYEGEVAYDATPALMRRAKVCLALNPTQFTHAFSERLLLSLASGCAALTDDRLWVREAFLQVPHAPCLRTFPIQDVDAMRASLESLLADSSQRVAIASHGRRIAEERHLWTHRLAHITHCAGMGELPGAPGSR